MQTAKHALQNTHRGRKNCKTRTAKKPTAKTRTAKQEPQKKNRKTGTAKQHHLAAHGK